MSMNWFRWYHGTVSDPKLALIAKKSGQTRPIVIAIWVALLEHASQAELRGDISGFDAETVAVALDIDEDAIPAVIAAITAKGMIADGVITAWSKRQPQREDDASTARVRAYRERQKQAETACNATKRTGTQGNAQEEEVEADTEAETEVSQKREETAQAPLASPPTPIVAPVIATTATATATNATEGPKTATKATKAPKPIKSPMPTDWTPAETTYALLEKHGMDRTFAEGCIDEFRLYWIERQEQRPGWESTFLNNVKRQWEHRPTPVTTKPLNGQRHPVTKHDHLVESGRQAIETWLASNNANANANVIEGECYEIH